MIITEDKISLKELRKVRGIGDKTIQRIRERMINRGKIEKKSIEEVGFPNKKYDVIYADPPWDFDRGHYQDGGRESKNINEFYPTMSIKELKSLPVNHISKDTSIIFCWVTDSHLKMGIEVIESWGFDYKTIAFNWIKEYKSGKRCVNFAPYTLKSWEICLLGTKGTPTKLLETNNVQGYVRTLRKEHSKKPDIVRDRIKDMIKKDADKIELFARQNPEGWDVWGDEV